MKVQPKPFRSFQNKGWGKFQIGLGLVPNQDKRFQRFLTGVEQSNPTVYRGKIYFHNESI